MGKIELEGSQIEELREALSSAFTEARLRQMLCFGLDWSWDKIKKGETYEDRLFNLIEHAESVGKVEELIISAAKWQSNNPKIQKFVETYVDKLMEFDAGVFTTKSLLSLLTILKKANEFQVIGELLRRILPKIETNCPQKFEDFQKGDLSNWFKGITLLKLLLEDYPQVEQRPSLLTFVEHLLKESKLDHSIKQQLKEWLHEIDPNFSCQPSGSEQVSLSASSQPASGALQAYLMIMVSSEKKTQVRAIASLLCISPTGDKTEIPVHLNPESNERGVLCTWKKLPQKVAEFIDRSISVELCVPANLLGCAYYALTIELFLPLNYLCEPVDRWDIKNEFGNSVYLGSQHRLVVRSYERVIKPGLKNAFFESWYRAKDLLGENPELARLQKIEHLEKIDCARWGTLKEALKEKIGIKITCPLPESQPERQKFLQAMLESGVPMAFWTRCRELSASEVIVGIDQFLTTELLLNRCNLLEKVKKERASAFDYCGMPQKRWGRHLTVLWDDLERMPTLESF